MAITTSTFKNKKHKIESKSKNGKFFFIDSCGEFVDKIM